MTAPHNAMLNLARSLLNVQHFNANFTTFRLRSYASPGDLILPNSRSGKERDDAQRRDTFNLHGPSIPTPLCRRLELNQR
jgi:hypothetical protein